MNNKYLHKLPEGCKSTLQEWVGERVDLERAILYSYVDIDPDFSIAIVVAFIGYTVNFYRLFAVGRHEWSISVDKSVPLDDLRRDVYGDEDEAQ